MAGVARLLAGILMAAAGLAVAAAPDSPAHPGAAIYQQHCAACHDRPDTDRVPHLAALQQMNARSLYLSLTQGVMQPQAQGIPRRSLLALVDYLAARETDSGEWLSGIMCDADDRLVDPGAAVTLPMVGVDFRSTRHLSAAQAGLSSDDLKDLELAWAIGFPDTTALRAAPAIVGSTMFYTPTQTGRLLALDMNVPCVKWVYDAETELRSSVTYGHLGDGGGEALVLADRLGRVHAVDPRNGERIWMVEGRHTEAGAITGAPVLYRDRIIVPVSASGVGRATDPNYECCAEHGAVVALDAATGRKLWTYHTMPDAEYTGEVNRLGVKLRGPSGAPIWSTPSIDEKRGLVYATTGQNTSLPATSTSDAVLAIDIESGELVWSFQALANDVWNLACRTPWERSGPNCPSPRDSVLKDFDFGAAAVIARRRTGDDILLAGQKSGDVWALHPDTGALLWNQRIGQGTPLGGIHWGLAIDGERVFAAINDPGPAGDGFSPVPGMNALDIDTGEVVWQQRVHADCRESRRARFERCGERFGLSAAPLVIDASVVAGGVDGRVYIYDARTGEEVFRYDTLRDFATLNGVPANGGAIDSHSLFAGAGMLFVASGYSSFGQAPGNVLLAFKPKPHGRPKSRGSDFQSR